MPTQVRNDQFFKGLSPDNVLEAERIGLDMPIERLVDTLSRVEKRKAEMHLGLASRSAKESALHKTITPVQVPQVVEKSAQEPLVSKPVITLENIQEHLGPLFKS